MFRAFQKLGFTAGVLAPRAHGRSDLEKYDLGLASAQNFFIDYLGPAVNRAGTEFLDYIQDDDEPARLFEFKFDANTGNTYAVLFAKDRIRFLQNGAYVLETATAVDSTTSSTVTTSSAHGLSVSDLVKLGSRTLIVATVPTTTTFTVTDPFGAAFDPSTDSPTSVARVYTVASPYATSILQELVFDQQLDTVYITHRDYATRRLTRTTATSWALNELTSLGYDAAITGLSISHAGAGTAGVVFAVVPVNAQGQEAPLSTASFIIDRSTSNYTTSSGWARLRWNPLAGAVKYRVYRSQVFDEGDNAHFGQQLGFVGETYGAQFDDENIVPDYTASPLIKGELLRPGGINQLTITATGSGFTFDPVFTAPTGGGSGFQGLPILDADAGTVIGALILDPGSGYVNPTLTVTSGGGTGTTVTATASSIAGSYPSATALVQQRRYYAGTNDNPSLFFASRIGDYDNFDSTRLGLDTDPLVFSRTQKESTNIRHMIESPLGMFMFGENSVSIIRGSDDSTITPSTIRADRQAGDGSGFRPVLSIGRDYLFLSPSSEVCWALRPSNLPTYFNTIDVSLLSSHFFMARNEIVSWTWAEDPHKLIWAPRADGSMLSCTYLAEQDVNAWAPHSTQGFFEDAESVSEDNVDRVYLIVRRKLRGVNKRVIERMALRNITSVEDMWAVDSGLRSTLPTPAASLDVGAFSGSAVTVTASASVFSVGDVGKTLRAGDGQATVTAYTSGTELTVKFVRPITEVPNQLSPPTYASGAWSLAANFTSFSGLDHLNGLEVEILADGRHLLNQTVTDGAITLETPSSYVLAGLGFSAEVETLPLTAPDAVIDTNQKRVVGVGMRLQDTRGAEAGSDPDYYAINFEQGTLYDVAPPMKSGISRVAVRADFETDGSVKVRKNGPQNIAILGLILETEFERQP